MMLQYHAPRFPASQVQTPLSDASDEEDERLGYKDGYAASEPAVSAPYAPPTAHAHAPSSRATSSRS